MRARGSVSGSTISPSNGLRTHLLAIRQRDWRKTGMPRNPRAAGSFRVWAHVLTVPCGSRRDREWSALPNSVCCCWTRGSAAAFRPAILRRWSVCRSIRCGPGRSSSRNWDRRASLIRRAGRSKGSRLPELTKRTILMLKQSHPEWGCQRISDMLFRGPALPASPSAVARVLHEAGYEADDVPTRPHPDQVRSFERARPNQLWQTDLFTFVLKRQNRRVYLVAFMDDHSRFLTGYGLHASQSAALVIEVLRTHGRLSRARGDPHRQRGPVHHLARQEPVHA